MFKLLLLVSPALACISTNPSTNPNGNTTTTTAAPCCPTDITKESTGRWVFEPALKSCPSSARFVCGVYTTASTESTSIIINTSNTIASATDGNNSESLLTCDLTTLIWHYGTTEVNSIQCNST